MEINCSATIIINNYNYNRFLRGAINSALSQTYPNTEIVVVDDGSTDSSQEIIKEYGDRVIPIIKKNGGQSSALNAGIENSSGEIILFLDADDIFLPDKVEKVINSFYEISLDSRECALIFDTPETIDESGKNLGLDPFIGSCEWGDLYASRCQNGLKEKKIVHVSTSDDVYLHAKKYRYIPYLGSPTSGLSITRSLANQIFPLPDQNIKTCADDFLVKAASLTGNIYFIKDKVTQYRIHGNNNWFGHKKPVKREFLNEVDCFLNLKLDQLGKPPVFSYFDSVHARNYYQGNCKDSRIYSKEIYKLSVRAMRWHVDARTTKFFIKAIFLLIASYIKSNKTLPDQALL